MSAFSSWLFLAMAIFFEVIGTTFMKLSMGLTRLWPTVAMFAFYSVAFVALAFSLKRLDVSVAYAIWAGVGILLITVIDLIIFKTSLTGLKLFAIGLILVGTIMLKILTKA